MRTLRLATRCITSSVAHRLFRFAFLFLFCFPSALLPPEFLVGLALLADTDLLGTGPASPDRDREADCVPTAAEIALELQQQQLKMSEPTLRLAFSMCDHDMDGLVQIVDLKRMFRRAFPDVAEAEVQAAFKDVAAAASAQQQGPLASPGGTENIGVTFEQFKDFCHSHPACVIKFKDTIFK